MDLNLSPEEEERIMAFIRKTEAACEFIPEGEPIPYDVGIRGIDLYEPEQSTTTDTSDDH